MEGVVVLVLLGAWLLTVAWCLVLYRALHRVEDALAEEADRLRSLELRLRLTR